MGNSRARVDVTILRGLGAPFSQSGDRVINQLRLKVQNRSDEPRKLSVGIVNFPEAQLVAPELPLEVAPAGRAEASFFVIAPRSALHGSRPVRLRIGDEVFTYTLLGPQGDD
jgi:hypothetical protein